MGDHLAISGGGFYRLPRTLSKQMFRGGRQVFQVGQAPSGPTVIRPLTGTPAVTQVPAAERRITASNKKLS